MQIIDKAAVERNEERIYQRWIAGYDKEIGFEEFKKNLIPEQKQTAPETEMTEKEILEKVKNILEIRR